MGTVLRRDASRLSARGWTALDALHPARCGRVVPRSIMMVRTSATFRSALEAALWNDLDGQEAVSGRTATYSPDVDWRS